MMAKKIEPFVHRCVVPSGDLAGNKAAREVSGWDIENQNECDVCGEVFAPRLEVLAHIYDQLLETE